MTQKTAILSGRLSHHLPISGMNPGPQCSWAGVTHWATREDKVLSHLFLFFYNASNFLVSRQCKTSVVLRYTKTLCPGVAKIGGTIKK